MQLKFQDKKKGKPQHFKSDPIQVSKKSSGYTAPQLVQIRTEAFEKVMAYLKNNDQMTIFDLVVKMGEYLKGT